MRHWEALAQAAVDLKHQVSRPQGSNGRSLRSSRLGRQGAHLPSGPEVRAQPGPQTGVPRAAPRPRGCPPGNEGSAHGAATANVGLRRRGRQHLLAPLPARTRTRTGPCNIEANPCVRVKVRTARVGWRGGTAHILDDDDARQPALPWECCEPREPRESCVPGTVLQLFVNCRLTVNGEHGANATLPVAQGTSLGPEPEPKPLRSSTPFTPPPTGRIRSGPVPSGPV